MKKRAMKKWIPKGNYCHGNGTKKFPNCKWRKFITTIKRDRSNCEFVNECNKKCWSDSNTSCRDIVYKCEYMNFIDWKQESLLWNVCKECGIKDY